jgi:hypothetical protein
MARNITQVTGVARLVRKAGAFQGEDLEREQHGGEQGLGFAAAEAQVAGAPPPTARRCPRTTASVA